MSRYLVTSALPYANGPLHLGHVAGAYLPADVYVRTLRMQGEEVAFVCGTDEHGVAITIHAEREGRPYAEYVAHWRGVIEESFRALGIEFDVFSGTSACAQHAPTAQEFFRRLDEHGYLQRRSSDQLYCPKDRMFLADRYVEGTCYVCGKPGARGDECPSCGAWIEPLRFEDPRCKLCGTTPERRETLHWYLDMPRLRDEHVGAWIEAHPWKPNVRAFVRNLLADVPLRPITRDMKWGVPVPEELAAGERDKVLYVWFDAPIGYVSFTKQWCEERGVPEEWEAWWKGPDARIVHFIGKDNIPFHCMLFPAMLWGVRQGYALPWEVPAHEFYNLEGRKFSTSAGWTIPLEHLLGRFDRDSVRVHVLASTPETADSEWTWQGFQSTVNAGLAGTIGNLATRVLKLVEKSGGARLPRVDPAHEAELDRLLLEQCGPIGDPGEHVRAFRFRAAVEQLVANAAAGNVFVSRTEPWALRKSDPERAASVLGTLCEWLAWIARWMAPFAPAKAEVLWAMLGQEGRAAELPWPGLPRSGAWRFLEAGRALGEVGPLFEQIPDEVVAAEVEALRERVAGS